MTGLPFVVIIKAMEIADSQLGEQLSVEQPKPQPAPSQQFTPEKAPFLLKPPFLILTILLFIAFVLGSYYLLRVRGATNQSGQSISQPIIIEKPHSQITPGPSIAVSQTPSSNKPKEWVLRKKVEKDTKEILRLPVASEYQVERNEEIPKIIRWKDLLFFPDFRKRNDGSNEIIIKSYNLASGETEVVFSQDEFKKDFGGTWQPTRLSDIKIINNTLFFSLGGEPSIAAYPERGGIFALDLLVLRKPVIISKMPDSTFISLGNNDFVYYALGAECGGAELYSLLDVQNKKIGGEITTSSGCLEGEDYIDLDNRDRMILSFHSGNSPYEYVAAVQLSDPNIKTEIISKKNIPGDIKTLIYSKEKDQLLLLGKAAYIYNFSTSTLNKIVDLPNDWEFERITTWRGQSWPNYIWKDDIVCIPVGHYDRPKDGNEINLRTKEIKKESDFCRSIYALPTPTPENKFKTYLDDLNLPPDYELIVE